MNKPTCVFQSAMWSRSGYGDWGLSVAKSLLRSDRYQIFLIPTRWGNCARKNLTTDILDEQEKILATKILQQPLNQKPDIFFQMSIPNEFSAIGKYNIGMTAFVESTCCAAPWLVGGNKMDLNIVLSNFNKQVFQSTSYTQTNPDKSTQQLKLERPIEVLPWCCDTNVFKKLGPNEPLEQSVLDVFSKIPEEFCFLFVGQWTHHNIRGDRKDIGMLIKTFLEAFKDKPTKPALILKSNGANFSIVDKYECLGKIKEATQMAGGGDLPNVYLLHGELTDKEMNSLYNHPKVKANVSFSHGEGWNGPMLQASLIGKPIIAPNWSGHLDFLNPDYCKLLDGQLQQLPPEALNDWFIKEAGWFVVDYSKASDVLKSMYHYYGAFLDKAEKLREENVKKFSLEEMDKQFWGILDRYVPTFAIQESIILPKLTLPKLRKIGGDVSSNNNNNNNNISIVDIPAGVSATNIPQTNSPPEIPKIVLPKLRKIT